MDKDVKKVILNMLETQLDEVLSMNEFKRKKNSFIYSRKNEKSIQKIEITYFLHPSYYKNALAHIYPHLSINYPDIYDLAKEILGDTVITSGLKNKILRQPIRVYHDVEDWVLYDEKSMKVIGEKIKDFLVKYTLPLLDDTKSIDGYLEAYRNNDKRLVKDDRQHIYFACAYALKNDFNKGYEIIKKRFGKKGPRQQYALLFKYFEEKIENKI